MAGFVLLQLLGLWRGGGAIWAGCVGPQAQDPMREQRSSSSLQGKGREAEDMAVRSSVFSFLLSVKQGNHN